MSNLNTRAEIDGEQRLASYELKGKKLSFSDRIANLSPEDTPFYSMSSSESIRQTLHQWQTDSLEAAKSYDGTDGAKSVIEGSNAEMEARKSTVVKSNNTQIFRKALAVSDTANATDNYGRAKELMYQMDKASKEIKRDLEATMLQSLAVSSAAAQGKGGLMAGFIGNCAVPHATDNSKVSFKKGTKATAAWAQATNHGLHKIADVQAMVKDKTVFADQAAIEAARNDFNAPDSDTGAITVFPSSGVAENTAVGNGTMTEKDIFDMTYQLYLAGSDANTIMFHPTHASFFASLQEKADMRKKVFTSGETNFSMYVSEIRDPLGRVYNLIPNRWMSPEQVFFLNGKDWSKMVLRPMSKVQLAKTGSSERWMLETEMTLKHRHPYASGVLVLKYKAS